MSEKRNSSRKRSTRESHTGSSSAAPQQYYGSPAIAHHPQAAIFPPMYGHPHYQYAQMSPPHLGRPVGFSHSHMGSMPLGSMHQPAIEPSMGRFPQQVTPESAAVLPYGSPPSSVRRRTFTGGAGTLSPSRSKRRSGEFAYYC